MVYTPADGSAATVLDVYDFQGSGVAMTMYNTDEVSLIWLHKNLIERCHPVHYWICPCVIQDGPKQEDATGNTYLTYEWATWDWRPTVLVYVNQEHYPQEIRW